MKIGFALAVLAGLSTSAQVPNGGFETWSTCMPDFWATSSACGFFETVTKSALAHSGLSAARGEVIGFTSQTIQPLLQSGEGAMGIPISQRHTGVEGFYIFAPVSGDRFAVNVVFNKGDNPIATGAALFPATAANTYTPFAVSMTYQTQDTPDRAFIQIQIIGPGTGSDFHLGSVMYVDDVSFAAGGGGPEARLSIVRNSNGTLTVTWPAEVTGYRLQRTSTLTPFGWFEVPLAPTERSFTFTPTPTGESYFRLIKP
jgi:hypothetical protein